MGSAISVGIMGALLMIVVGVAIWMVKNLVNFIKNLFTGE